MSLPDELVRAFFEAWNQRDVETIRALAHEDVEYVNPPMALEPGTRHGRDELVRVCEAQWEVLDSVAVERVESREDGHLSVQMLRGTIPGSDTQLDTPVVSRWSFRDGLLTRLEILGLGSTFEDALKEAGLEGSP